MLELQQHGRVTQGLSNDNWIGYVNRWIYEVGVTWMEKTVASPHWTGMTLFTVRQEGKLKRKKAYALGPHVSGVLPRSVQRLGFYGAHALDSHVGAIRKH